MAQQTAIPHEVFNYLVPKYGAPISIIDMGGINPGEVYRIDFKTQNFITKKVPHRREIVFYEKLAPVFNKNGLQVPFLEWSGSSLKLPWIVIEHIPHALPEHRWETDEEVIEYLAAIHNLKSDFDPSLLYRPTWDEEMNLRVLDCFDPKDKRKMENILSTICSKSQHLFLPDCLISGDPNPKNWGLRSDGSLVQYDWQHIGLGTPALDLAISICSSENTKTCENVARIYLSKTPDTNFKGQTSVAELATSIMLGCAWNYVRFLDRYMAGKVNVPEKVIDHIAEFFPDWISREISKKVA
jgi:hypothetical protein